MDALRGGASIAVALFHFNVGLSARQDPWHAVCTYGWLGVPVFFVISGWCMAMILRRERDPVRFIIRRFMRIFPPYWLSLLVVLACVAWRLHSTGVNDAAVLPRSVSSVVATLLLVTSPATPVPTMNGVYWSLTYEVTFYLLVCVGLILKKPTLLLGAILPLSLLNITHSHFDSDAGALFFTDQYPLFALGFFGYRLVRKIPSALALAASAALCFYTNWWQPAVLGGLTLLLLLFSETPHGKKARWLFPLAVVGDFSYSLYLIHVPVGGMVLPLLSHHSVAQPSLKHAALDLIALAICMLIAWVMHLTIEQPSHEWGRWLARRFGPTPGS